MSVNEKMGTLANAIREKTGGTEPLSLDAMAAAVAGLSTGEAAIMRTTGTFTTDDNCTAVVNCGFKPDVLVGYVATSEGKDFYYSFVFPEYAASDYPPCIDVEDVSCMICMTASAVENGFVVQMEAYNFNWEFDDSAVKNQTFPYTAIKYTP